MIIRIAACILKTSLVKLPMSQSAGVSIFASPNLAFQAASYFDKSLKAKFLSSAIFIAIKLSILI